MTWLPDQNTHLQIAHWPHIVFWLTASHGEDAERWVRVP